LLLLLMMMFVCRWCCVPGRQEGTFLEVHQASVVQLPDGQAGDSLVHLQQQQEHDDKHVRLYMQKKLTKPALGNTQGMLPQ
jgi:hypothetical protein